MAQLIQRYSGYATVEPEWQVVIAQVADRDFFFTTVIDVFQFDSIKMIESGNAITIAAPVDSPESFWGLSTAINAALS
jgi:hypothetical protein